MTGKRAKAAALRMGIERLLEDLLDHDKQVVEAFREDGKDGVERLLNVIASEKVTTLIRLLHEYDPALAESFIESRTGQV